MNSCKSIQSHNENNEIHWNGNHSINKIDFKIFTLEFFIK